MKYRFIPEDFLFGNVEGDGARIVAQASADRANAILQEWEKESETIYGLRRVIELITSDLTIGPELMEKIDAILWNPRKIEEK